MATPASEGCGQCAAEINRSRKLLSAFSTGRITLEEYAYNLAISLVTACSKCVDLCINALPVPLVADVFGYLEGFLKPVDFTPCPKPFMPGGASQEEIEQTKHRLRPKYIQLYQVVKNKVSAAAKEQIARC